ncbi:hypothetical protein [Hymenobacter guriensis]|uniref:6-bladed beta-propeller n=1 Tax=Hymenobacter guriensis TaxID=2793065 RepID=A0ABS0KY35_9BACT|nr:hypothetical protein [Hymenobacter guriensis]MBG8552788.1 hypothetical protein [Hymenobacter guriensis]
MSQLLPAAFSGNRLRFVLGGFVLALLVPGRALAQTTVPAATSVAPPAKTAPAAATPAASAAAWTLVRSIPLPKAGAASLDRRGTLYVADAQNNLRQYAADGQALNTYSAPLPGHVAQLEAWNLTKVLAFYDDRQEVLLLDRFLAPLTQVRLTDYLDGLIRVATLAPDDKLWLLNESDLTLRQFDSGAQRLVASTPLDLLVGRTRPDFRFLRQYQNNLYLVDFTSGIYVFDNLGTYRKKLPFAGLNQIGFRGDELYFLRDGALHFFQLYTLTERTVPLPSEAAASRLVLLGEKFAYLFTDEGILVYHL